MENCFLFSYFFSKSICKLYFDWPAMTGGCLCVSVLDGEDVRRKAFHSSENPASGLVVLFYSGMREGERGSVV